MTDADFDYLCTFVRARSGLALTPEKRYLLESRLQPLGRKRGFETLEALVRALRAGDAELERAVVEAMTTNETFFFRDKTPFDTLRNDILPRLLEARASTRALRIWCAAASTGQEPYSLAMMLDQMGERLAGWRIEILGTDLSTQALERARAGLYSQFEVQRGLPVQLLLRYFTQTGDSWQIAPELRQRITFRPFNLMRDFSPLGTFDIVFCRNVLLYFDMAMKADILARIGRQIAPDGCLFLGAAETVIGLGDEVEMHPTLRGVYVPRRRGATRAA
ncbi:MULTISPECIES: protein-glutamate O-methyltransferase CheR [Chelatococcus]|uniref:protein-glutamate O-methyltransferase n=1 Tax=Chelatococcus caeni TaxID=1348468 RepID=A0A840C322_9HYPH|nr:MULTISPECIES: protein-glutamate O-methyltransferase CheR [Chelatococcus]ALA16969.1 chemotaxis protein CheR [Chelatococcus sp. CO-6]MBB4017316.1 chemotaxis protein methyltransferase CheR [Chelatococcus caeni]